MSELVEWVVTVNEGADAGLVAARISAASVHVEAVLDHIGCIVVKASVTAGPQLLAISGVSSVERSDGVDVGPPDSGNTW